MKSRREKDPVPHVRGAKPEDLPRLVEIDLECFEDVYAENPIIPEDVYEMLKTRQAIAKELMVVGEINGRIEGFMTCQRTNAHHDDIKSWEETTNNGTLVGTHVPDGRNFYIVNLTTTKEGSRYHLSDQLIARLLGRFLEIQGESAQLLSRIPQFSQWVIERQIRFDELSEQQQDELANEYIRTTKAVDGEHLLYDGMLRRYASFGARPVGVLRDGFGDPASNNYSVVCVFDNPLPERLRANRMVSKLAGLAIRMMANHPKLLQRLP